MAMSQAQQFYNDFKRAVKKRTVDNMAVPVSGGLDSTLIVKALCDNGDIHKCRLINIRDGNEDYVYKLQEKFMFSIKEVEFNYFPPFIPNDIELERSVEVWEEPYYAASINYYLFLNITCLGMRVCMSGCGADELFGGYTYYNTPDYPRGFFRPVEAKSNAEKRIYDLDLLIYHHLRKMDKMGMYFQVESRYPYLDSKVMRYNDVGKSMIKEILLQDFDDDFVNRPKQGFRAGESSKEMYLKQVALWIKLFG